MDPTDDFASSYRQLLDIFLPVNQKAWLTVRGEELAVRLDRVRIDDLQLVLTFDNDGKFIEVTRTITGEEDRDWVMYRDPTNPVSLVFE
jgi:hypothetical protein